MNYLAHIYLSGSDPHVQIGGLLGDFVKGPLRRHYPDRIEAGIRLHRHIDATTDRHPAFRRHLADLPPPWRRFGGILLDVYFDHLLASRWGQFHPRALDDFCADFYHQLSRNEDLLPEGARYFCRRAPQVRWLENYAERDMIPLMLDNLGRRLRRPVALGEAWPHLEARREALTQTFHQLIREHRTRAQTFIRDLP